MNVTNETVNDSKLKLLLIICLSLALSSQAHPLYILNKSQSRSRCDKESWANNALKKSKLIYLLKTTKKVGYVSILLQFLFQKLLKLTETVQN